MIVIGLHRRTLITFAAHDSQRWREGDGIYYPMAKEWLALMMLFSTWSTLSICNFCTEVRLLLFLLISGPRILRNQHYNTERTGTSLPPLFMHQYLVKTSEPSLHLRDNLPTIFTNIPAHALIPPTLAWRYTRYRSSFHQVPLRSDLASRLYRLDVVPMCRRPYLFRRSCNFLWVCRLRNLLTNCVCGCDREEF